MAPMTNLPAVPDVESTPPWIHDGKTNNAQSTTKAEYPGRYGSPSALLRPPRDRSTVNSTCPRPTMALDGLPAHRIVHGFRGPVTRTQGSLHAASHFGRSKGPARKSQGSHRGPYGLQHLLTLERFRQVLIPTPCDQDVVLNADTAD